jgi:hypothetical protein
LGKLVTTFGGIQGAASFLFAGKTGCSMDLSQPERRPTAGHRNADQGRLRMRAIYAARANAPIWHNVAIA